MALTTYNITGNLEDATGAKATLGEVTFTPYGTHDARVDGADAMLGPIRYSLADLPATVALTAGAWIIVIRSTGRVNGDQQFRTITRTIDLQAATTWGDIVAGAISSPPMTPTLVEEAQAAAAEAEMWASTAQGVQDTAVQTLVDDPTSATRASLSATYARTVTSIDSTAAMTTWLDAVAAVRAGTGFAKLAFIGDSKTAGVFTGATLATSYPTAVKKRLGLMIPTQDGLIFPNATETMEPRIVEGGYAYSGGMGPAGASWYANTAAGADMVYSPVGTVDTFDVWTYNNATKGTIAIKIDGVAQTPLNCAVGDGWTKTTYTATAGVHTMALPKPTVGEVYVLGVDAYLSANKAVRVTNWGVPGSTAGNWTNTTGGIQSLSAVTAHDADLSVIMLGGNDASAGVTAADFATRMGLLIDAAKAGGGNVILVATTQSNPTLGRLVLEEAYRDELVTLSASKDAPLIDAWELFGAYNTADWADDVHLTARGYARLGRLIFEGITQV